jgi:hypothetical protein
VLVSESDYTLALQSESEYTLCLTLSTPLLLVIYTLLEKIILPSLIRPCAPIRVQLQLESRPLLLQAEYTFYLNLSRPYILPREREYLFYRFTPTLSGKSVCGQLLIRSILVLYSVLKFPRQKNIKKKLQQKKSKKK